MATAAKVNAVLREEQKTTAMSFLTTYQSWPQQQTKLEDHNIEDENAKVRDAGGEGIMLPLTFNVKL